MKKFVAWVNRVFTHNRDLEHDFGIWKDVFGAMVGFVLGRLVLVALITWGVIILLKGV